MKESISIKNLGPIKNIFIEDIRPITILIGESGSGKSTLMKTISLFRWIYKMHNIRSYLKRGNVSKSPFRFIMNTYFKDCGLEQYISSDTEIEYSIISSSEQKYVLKFANNKLHGTEEKNLININDLQYSKISFISETRNIIPLWADRGASLAGAYLGFYFHEVYNDFELASESIKEIDVDYLDLKLSIKKAHSKKKFTVESLKEKYEIDLKSSSSGIQNVIPVSLIVKYFANNFNFEDAFNHSIVKFLSKNDKLTDFRPVKNLSDIQKKMYIHIEEPELSLYPDAQCDLIGDLISKCFVSNTNQIELMLSTHSPYIINYLNLLIKAYDCDTFVKGARIKFENLSVFQVCDGEIKSLMAQNERVVNTNLLSDTINQIYDNYETLGAKN